MALSSASNYDSLGNEPFEQAQQRTLRAVDTSFAMCISSLSQTAAGYDNPQRSLVGQYSLPRPQDSNMRRPTWSYQTVEPRFGACVPNTADNSNALSKDPRCARPSKEVSSKPHQIFIDLTISSTLSTLSTTGPERSRTSSTGYRGASHLLSTGECVSQRQLTLRSKSHIPGFPSFTDPISQGLDSAEVVKFWPNHLWGSLLLGVCSVWAPQEIAGLAGGGDVLTLNAVKKRIESAKQACGLATLERGSKKRKRQNEAEIHEHKERSDQSVSSSTESSTSLSCRRDQFIASNAFLQKQLEAQAAMVSAEPFYDHRRIKKVKKGPTTKLQR